MTTKAGIWIDHRKAVVVLITDKGEDVLQIMPDRDTPAPSPGGARVKKSYTPNDFVAEDRRQRKAMSYVNKFYDEVIDCLRDADAILVLGPGEAKGEFIKRLERQKLSGQITHVGAMDKMTDRQFTAHVRKLIGVGAPQATTREAQTT